MGKKYYVRIIDVPPGEAPAWVREKWLGLELPLSYLRRKPRTAYAGGVLSGPRNLLSCLKLIAEGRLERQSMYFVRVADALDILEKSEPAAAKWWRENTPHLLKGMFGFHAKVCRYVEKST